MSLTASYVIVFVIFIRLLIRKAPKFISYALWGVVGFRLVIPFSFESVLSLMPRDINTSPIPHNILYQERPQINSGVDVIDSVVNNSLPAATAQASVNPLQIATEIGAYIWFLGTIALLVYSIVSILNLKRQLKSANLLTSNIYEAKNLKTPFVLGLIRPKIYLPYGLKAEERKYILLHEQTHIKRRDHQIKAFAFLILTIHWFNPLVWISFILMSKDMELSCDERVLREMGGDNKKSYASSLLSLATKKHILNGSPIAFGEGRVKGRIKNVLNYKKPRFWVVTILIIVVTAVGIGLMANPKTDMIKASFEEKLWAGRTNYVGDNSAVGNLIGLLPSSEGLQYDHFKLNTKERPYAVEIIYSASTETLNHYDTEEKHIFKAFENNALVLLALIDNVDEIRSTFTDGEQELGFKREREWANDIAGRDVRDYADSPEKLRELIDLGSSKYISDSNSIFNNGIVNDNIENALPENYIILDTGEWPKNTYTSNIPQPDSGIFVRGWIDPDSQYCYIEMEDVNSDTMESWYGSLLDSGFTEVERMAEQIKGQDYKSTNAMLQNAERAINITHLSNEKGMLIMYITK